MQEVLVVHLLCVLKVVAVDILIVLQYSSIMVFGQQREKLCQALAAQAILINRARSICIIDIDSNRFLISEPDTDIDIWKINITNNISAM